jgi:hypothetical protein
VSIVGDITSFANPFGSQAKGSWNLSPGTWTDSKTGVKTVFFAETRSGDANGQLTSVDNITDSASRRLAVYEYPYLDGQQLKDMGRKGESYTFTIKFFGPNYQTKYKEFYNNVYKSNSAGTLTHPVLSAIRGSVLARLQSFEQVHRVEESNAVTIRATFIEDDSGIIGQNLKTKGDDVDTALQKSLKRLVSTSAAISNYITGAAATLQLPGAITAGLNARKTSLVGQVSGLLGQLGSTFATKNDLINLFAIAGPAIGGVPDANYGTVAARTSTGTTEVTKIAPVFQVALDPASQTLVDSQLDSFVNANKISPAQAVYGANQARQGISDAIKEAESTLGNYGYDIVVLYRQLAVNIQDTVEACITSAESKVKIYKVPRNMSLRMIAYSNGLSPDRQNDIEALNPYLGSINLIPAGSTITVPAS